MKRTYITKFWGTTTQRDGLPDVELDVFKLHFLRQFAFKNLHYCWELGHDRHSNQDCWIVTTRIFFVKDERSTIGMDTTIARSLKVDPKALENCT